MRLIYCLSKYGLDAGVSMFNAHCIENFVADVNDIDLDPNDEFEESCA